MGLLGETFETRRDLYLFKLGAALTMEQKIVDMLEQLSEHAKHGELALALRRHHEQTRQHVRNIELAFEALGEDVDDSPCPAIEGLEKDGQATLKMVDEGLNDDVILAGVCETEHHEIAVYEGLITRADALGETQVAELLRQNLVQEQTTLEEAQQMTKQLARGMPVS